MARTSRTKASRREFLSAAGKGIAVSSVAAGFPAIVPASVFGAAAPSNRINIGAIGTGRISRGHDLPGLWKHEAARIMAVCDVDRNRAEDAKKAAPTDAAPDNTKVNERDTNSAAPTPMDQGNNASDLKITQKIRQAVMADGSLSFTAKNVKIITQNGKVTLRGPVNSEDERSRIEAAARKVAGTAVVDNQLEVKK